jgi:hypothetical protein
MTKYYTDSIQALKGFIAAIKMPTDANVMILDKWIKTIEPLAAALTGQITLVQNEQKALSKARGVGSARLGLRLAGINPRGPFGIPTEDTAHGAYNQYRNEVKKLGGMIVNLLDAIQGPNKKRDDRGSELAAISMLLASYAHLVSEATRVIIEKFRGDLYNYVKKLDLKDEARLEPDPNSSYWPSSFIVSSSSSSSLPPP